MIREFRSYLAAGLAEVFQVAAECTAGFPAALAARIKRLDSILRKLRRKSDFDLVRMQDIVGIRIVAASPDVQTTIVQCLRRRLGERLHKIDDYNDAPRPGGYRAIHLIARLDLPKLGTSTPGNYRCEVQVRTHYQNLWGTVSESFGERAKEGNQTPEERQYLEELSALIRASEEAEPTREQTTDLNAGGNPQFWVVHYDKRSGRTETKIFGSDLKSAINYMQYLEDVHRADLSHEAVLLGDSKESGAIQKTHLRYFSPRGIPELPGPIRPTRNRPQAA